MKNVTNPLDNLPPLGEIEETEPEALAYLPPLGLHTFQIVSVETTEIDDQGRRRPKVYTESGDPYWDMELVMVDDPDRSLNHRFVFRAPLKNEEGKVVKQGTLNAFKRMLRACGHDPAQCGYDPQLLLGHIVKAEVEIDAYQREKTGKSYRRIAMFSFEPLDDDERAAAEAVLVEREQPFTAPGFLGDPDVLRKALTAQDGPLPF